MVAQIIQSLDSGDQTGESGRYDRIFPISVVAIVGGRYDRDAEQPLRLRDRAAHAQVAIRHAAGSYGEALGLEPLRERREIALVGAEARGKLLRSQPAVIIGRAGILLVGKQLVKRGLVAQREHDFHLELPVGRRGSGRL